MVLRTVRILLRTSATKTAIFSVCGGSSVYLCGLKFFATSEYLFSLFFLKPQLAFVDRPDNRDKLSGKC